MRALATLTSLLLSVHPAPTTPTPTPTPTPTLTPADSTRTDPALRSLRWRLVGPFRGGRVDAVTGDPVHPLTFYMGAVDGGVWKTEDAGQSWRNISDDAGIASVGAIAVAPSDPNVIYVGGGESNPREDITYGEGFYRSGDGGRSWQRTGLTNTRHIADVVVDPKDARTLYVAALGHAFGPSPDRGVYRSRDGGRSFEKVLFVNDSTGAIDLAMDPSNPRVIYAAMWKFQRMPWGFSAGGGRSGLWKTTDGGDTWLEISHNSGLPAGPLGRIGVSVSGADPDRVWASVEAPDSAGGIFRSDDAGKSWKRVNADQKFMVRPWYFSGVTADPEDENTVYVLNLGTWRSVDGGESFQRIRAPHGDDHILWIDSHDPQRMIEGNDGGATVSLDGGSSWSSIMNQPTAQFYHVVTDDQFPYRIYGAQQDNSTVSIASRAPDGAIDEEDWFSVGGGESGYIAPKPGAPDTVYAGTYMGTMTRWSRETGEERDVSVWLNNYDGYAASDVPYRFQWTFPIVFSPHDPGTLYVTSQYVHRSKNGGAAWERISPDLTLHDPATMGSVGGPITLDMTGTEWYATIFAFAESPVKAGVLWAGSDDGLVHVSTDDGGTWTDVTPKGLPRFTRISIIEPSHHDAGTAYIAANRFQLDDFRPYLFRTSDYGRTWSRIDGGIPDGAYARSIREDPATPGLLFAGTETGIYFSTDDGAHWRSLQLNLPKASVRDIAVHDADLIVATHGRAFWVLDDIAPLRALAGGLPDDRAELLTPRTTVRYLGSGRRSVRGAGENPPNGVTIDYWLPSGAHATQLELTDSTGTVIRTFSADTSASADSTDVAAADSLAFAPADSIVPSRPGFNRFVWDLAYPPAHEPKDIVLDVGLLDGPTAVPGRYTVRLTIDGRALTQSFAVVEDPRTKASDDDLRAQFDLATKIHQAIRDVVDADQRIESMDRQLAMWKGRAKDQPWADSVVPPANALRDSLAAIREQLVCVHCHAAEFTLAYPIRAYNKLTSLNLQVLPSHTRPTEQEQAVFRELRADVDTQLGRLEKLRTGPLGTFNEMIVRLRIPAVAPPAAGAGGR